MMRRGSTYWLWADCELHCRSYEEVLSDGSIVDVQTRISRKGRTQLFIGVYYKNGVPLFEKVHDWLPKDTMTTALDWGVGCARKIARENMVFAKSSERYSGRESARTAIRSLKIIPQSATRETKSPAVVDTFCSHRIVKKIR